MSPQLLSGAARLAGSSLLRLQSDERLVALIRDGHDPAFSAVVDRYRGELLRYATRIVGDSRAEDAVQQAFVNAHQAMTSSDSDINLRPWLYRIAHNAALNILRAGRRVEELDDRLAAAGGVEQTIEHRERLREALAAIARLPEPQRDALTLQALQGRSHEEIAAALNVSSGAARQQVHRARGAVRAAVSAITPYGLLARFAMAGGGEPASAIVTGAGAAGAGAAGISATVAKLGAGVLAAGAIATGTTGHVPFVGHAHKAKAAAQTHGRAEAEHAAAAAESAAATAEPVSDDHSHRNRGSDSSGRGREDSGRGKGKRGAAAAGDDGSRHGSDDSSGSAHKGSGSSDDNGRSGSGDHGSDDGGRSGSGSDDGERSGSGSKKSGSSLSGGGSDDGEHSGSGSGSGGSDDAVVTAPVVSEGSRGGSDDATSLDGSGSGTSGGDDGRSGSESGSSGSGSSGSGSSGGGSDDGLPDD